MSCTWLQFVKFRSNEFRWTCPRDKPESRALDSLESCNIKAYHVKNIFFMLFSSLPMITALYNWQKWKRVFLTCPCHEIYRDVAVGLKSCKYSLKNIYDLCEYVEFGAISWKFDILSITAQLKFESKNSFAQVWHI